MSAQYETLITFKAVTDHDCGTYSMGEVDWGIHGTVDGFIKTYGDKGIQDLFWSMDIVKEQLLARWREQNKFPSAECAAKATNPLA